MTQANENGPDLLEQVGPLKTGADAGSSMMVAHVGTAVGAGFPTGTAVEHVLRLAARGWCVFPLRPDDKRPAVADWERKATTDPDRIGRAWTGPFANCGVGVACGPSRLVVVDLDMAKGETPPAPWDLPGITDGCDVLAELYDRHGDVLPIGRTPAVQTGSGGLHLYFAAPETEVRNSASKIGWKIDVRAAGGYVVAPPSIVAGRPYRWQGPAELELTPIPAWLVDGMQRRLTSFAPPCRSDRAVERPPNRAAALTGLVKVVLEAAPGTRNDRLYWAACRAREHVEGGLVDEREIASALVDTATRIGLSEAEARATINSAYRSGAAA